MMLDPMMILNMMIQRNPGLSRYWQTAQKMAANKSPQELQNIASNIAKQNGLDMNQIKQQIQQIMNGNGTQF